MADIESMKEIQTKKWGGAREGAGRPTHSKNSDVAEREEAARQFKQRVAKNADRIFNSQLDLALGEKYLMVIRTTGKGAKAKRETSIVTNPDLIKRYLDEDLEDTDEEYYFMTTKPANNMALDSLLNRSFGKAEEKIALEHSGEIKSAPVDPALVNEFVDFMKNKKG